MGVKILSTCVIFGACLAASGCAMEPMTMNDVAALPDTELCVDYALATIYGPGTTSGGKVIQMQDVEYEMGRRGQSCEPKAEYFQIAQARVQQAMQRQQAMNQAVNNYANYLQRQQAINNANRPVTTNCMANGNMATCTTY